MIDDGKFAQAIAAYNNASFRYNRDCNQRLKVKESDPKRSTLKNESQKAFNALIKELENLNEHLRREAKAG